MKRLPLVPRWLVPILVFLIVLGHACELPAFVNLVAHGSEDAHHSADNHADENLISCDGAVGLRSSTGYLQVARSFEAAKALPVASVSPARPIISAPDNSVRLASRPPLFLLYASLLI